MTATAKLSRGLLIDPVAKTVQQLQAGVELQDLYRILECTTVEAVRITDRDYLWVDEEGLYAQPPKPFFSFASQLQNPYCGKALIFGSDGENIISTTLPLLLVWQNVVFRDLVYDGMTIKERVIGGNMTVLEQRAHFKPREG
jgi:hypothetical protein